MGGWVRAGAGTDLGVELADGQRIPASPPERARQRAALGRFVPLGPDLRKGPGSVRRVSRLLVDFAAWAQGCWTRAWMRGRMCWRKARTVAWPSVAPARAVVSR